MQSLKDRFCSWSGHKLISFSSSQWMPYSLTAGLFQLGCWMHKHNASKDGVYESW